MYNSEIKKELKSIFIGEACLSAGFGLSALGMLLMYMMGRGLNDASSFVGADMISSALITVSAVLSVIAIFFIAKGCLSAGKKEPLFNSSLICFAISITAAFAEPMLRDLGVIQASAASVAHLVFAAGGVILGAKGVAALSENDGDKVLAAISRSIVRPVCSLSSAAVLMTFSAALMETVSAQFSTAIIVSIVASFIYAAICDIYASVLAKASKEENAVLFTEALRFSFQG